MIDKSRLLNDRVQPFSILGKFIRRFTKHVILLLYSILNKKAIIEQCCANLY